ncbi:MAG: naiP [Pedosphaera sp.]|nr:naiP [Pedosphaera sp.]
MLLRQRLEKGVQGSGAVVAPAVDKETGRAIDTTAHAAGEIFSDAGRMGADFGVEDDTPGIEAKLPCVLGKILVLKRELIFKQQVVHVPKVSLVGGGFGSFRRVPGMRMHRDKGKVAIGELQLIAHTFENGFDQLMRLAAERAFVIAILNQGDARVRGPQRVIALADRKSQLCRVHVTNGFTFHNVSFGFAIFRVRTGCLRRSGSRTGREMIPASHHRYKHNITCVGCLFKWGLLLCMNEPQVSPSPQKNVPREGNSVLLAETKRTAYDKNGGRSRLMATQIKSNVVPAQSTALTRAQWLVLLAALLGWLFDGYEIGLFPVVARPALKSILGAAGNGSDAVVGNWMGIITACFLIGAALGGVMFGWLGDRIGRVRAMGLSILTYSLVTGLGYFAQTPEQLGAVRFVSALGMGGQWSLGVALVMECWPEKWRPLLAGAMGAAANIGQVLVGLTAKLHEVRIDSWRWMMLVGALPALLVVFILSMVPESERWRTAAKKGGANPVREIFSPSFIKITLLGVVFASVALIGTWGSVQWLPLWADQLAGKGNPAAKANTQVLLALGATIGSLIAPFIGARFGRRPAYFLLCAVSLGSCALLFRTVHEFGGVFLGGAFWVGAVTASFYGWFPLYFPELFPTRVRATGQGVCYNSGRVLAAAGALTQGQLVGYFGGSYAQAGAIVTLVYLVGMAAIWFAPETKGRTLPE